MEVPLAAYPGRSIWRRATKRPRPRGSTSGSHAPRCGHSFATHLLGQKTDPGDPGVLGCPVRRWTSSATMDRHGERLPAAAAQPSVCGRHPITVNSAVSALRFFFRVTLGRREVVDPFVREPPSVPVFGVAIVGSEGPAAPGVMHGRAVVGTGDPARPSRIPGALVHCGKPSTLYTVHLAGSR